MTEQKKRGKLKPEYDLWWLFFPLWRGYNAELLHQAQGIRPFPAFHELAADNAVDVDPPHRQLLIGGGTPHKLLLRLLACDCL